MIALFLFLIFGTNCILNNYSTSKNGINFLTIYERYISVAVEKNKEGFYCVGFNHCGEDVKYGTYVPREKAREFLSEDLKKFEKWVNDPNYVTVKLNQNQFDALVCYAYEFGSDRLKELCYKKNISEIEFHIDDYYYGSAGERNKGENLKKLFNRLN